MAEGSTGQVAELVVSQESAGADGATANTRRARGTDALGNRLAGQTVSVWADNGATTAPTVTTEPDGTVELAVTSQPAGTSTVTASVYNSTQRRNVTLLPGVRTAQPADVAGTQ
ncbi:Ig-like domain-containing protein, partial [Escherichia coli]|uniref:Ig-like domain-containing protein n=1 Tax=Escherichia coli TaxID=562 RepID=UPI003D9B4D7E